MPRNYPPMSVAACIQAARTDALNHWNGAGGGVHNCGHQGTEYTTVDRMEAVKTNWRNAGTLVVAGVPYIRTASNSASATGIEIDLKLVPAATPAAAAVFNYHIAIDIEAVDPIPPPNVDKQKDAWRIMNNLRREEYRGKHGGSTSGYVEMPFKPWS